MIMDADHDNAVGRSGLANELGELFTFMDIRRDPRTSSPPTVWSASNDTSREPANPVSASWRCPASKGAASLGFCRETFNSFRLATALKKVFYRSGWRALRRVGVLLIGSAVAYISPLLVTTAAAGQYRPFQLPKESILQTVADPLQRTRAHALSQFTASSELIIFPTPVAPGQVGLMVIDRRTDRPRLIASEGTFFTYPQLSVDGERLLLVRTKGGTSQLLSCGVQNWQCRVAAQSAASITWPIELDQDRILYSSSPLVAGGDGVKRYGKHDFYLAERSREPVQLTDFQLFELGPLDVFDSKLMFAAYGPSKQNPIIPQPQARARSNSEIFALGFDRSNPRIRTPEHILEPLYVIDGGLSIIQTVSPDGTKVAILNTWTGIGHYRYDLVIATIEGAVLKRVDASTLQFSRAAFVGSTTVVANQLFDDRYEVTMVDIASNSTSKAATVEHSRDAVRDLDRIQITGISD
jgi:hypothetical protein